MEIWDLYNVNRELIGKDHIRGEELPDNAYHLVVHVWIKNKKGQYLISQRAANCPTFPLMWESVGGSVLKGESSLQGAIREVKEEIGVEITGTNDNLVFSRIRKIVDGKKFNDIVDVWLFDYNDEVMLSEATTDEVEQVKWMTVEEVKELYDNKKLVSTLAYFFNCVAK